MIGIMNANLTLSDVVFFYFLTSSHAISTAWLLVKKLKKNHLQPWTALPVLLN
jgi:hypothetical protein